MKKLIDAIKKALGMDKKSPDSSSSGFTLIELLVVIAVIGVLAAGILIAIDPLEQIRRAQDSSTKEQTAAVGRAVEAYYINSVAGSSATGSYPAETTAWLTTALAGDFKVTPTGNSTACGTGRALSGGFCLDADAAAPSFVVYTTLKNKSDRNRAAAAAGSGCGTAATTYYVYSSALGKAGITCAEPTNSFSGTLY